MADQITPPAVTAQTTQQAIQKVVNTDQVESEANTSIAQTAQRRMEAGVFWKELLADPLGSLQKEIESYLPGDGPAQSFAKDLLSGMQSGRFDPESALATYANSSLPTAYSGPTVISGLGSGNPVASKGVARSGKSISGVTNCARNALAGTVATVAKMAVGAIDPSLKAAVSLQQTFSAVSVSYPDFVSAFMLLPVESLSVFLTDKDTLLDRLLENFEKAYEVLLSMTDDDYGFDHQQAIREALEKLRDAESDTSTVESILLQGGNFLETVWDRAKTRVNEASTILFETTPDNPFNNKQMRLVGYLTAIDMTMQVLLCRQSIIERLYGNIASFTADFKAESKYDNLYGPILDQISCLLRGVIGDMEAAANKSSALSLFVKEKEWFLQLRTILEFMRNAQKLSTDVPSSSEADAFSLSFSADAESDNNTNDFTALVNLVNEFKTQVRGALMMPLPNPARLEKIVEATLVEIDRQKQITSRTEDKLQSFASNFNQEAMAEAITVMKGIIDFATSRNLMGMVKALREGDIKGFFSTAFQSSDEERALSGIVDLIDYASTTMPEELRALKNAYTVLRGRVRGENLYKRLVSHSADQYIRNQKEQRLPENNALQRLIRRVNNRLNRSVGVADSRIAQVQERIDQVSGVVDTAVSQIAGAVTRPDENRPVSCAGR